MPHRRVFPRPTVVECLYPAHDPEPALIRDFFAILMRGTGGSFYGGRSMKGGLFRRLINPFGKWMLDIDAVNGPSLDCSRQSCSSRSPVYRQSIKTQFTTSLRDLFNNLPGCFYKLAKRAALGMVSRSNSTERRVRPFDCGLGVYNMGPSRLRSA
jgi:hypothetical protein